MKELGNKKQNWHCLLTTRWVHRLPKGATDNLFNMNSTDEFSKAADAKSIYQNQLHLHGIKYRTKLLKIFVVGLNLIIYSFNPINMCDFDKN